MVSATVSLLWLACAAASGDPLPVYHPSPVLAAAVRGQSPEISGESTLSAQPDGSTVIAPPINGAPGGVYLTDPFIGGQPVPQQCAPCGPTCDPGVVFGAVGPQPYRFGWSSRADVAYLPHENTSDGLGRFEIFETNAALRYTAGIPEGFPDLIFAWTPEYNLRLWEGPQHLALPGNVHRFASDFELSTPANNPVSLQLGFTPAFASDLDVSPNEDAWTFDGRGVVFIQVASDTRIAIGTAYLDRVNDRWIPYGGVIWTPDPRFEARLMYPKARISYQLGAVDGIATWIYTSVEYNIEAYQIGLRGPGGQPEQIQIADYRALIGLRTDDGNVAAFIEAGYVFERDVDFKYGTPDFSIAPGLITRMGLRF